MSANDHMHQSSFEDLVARFEDPEREKWQMPDKVIAMMGDLEGKTIMEIGAGTGYFGFRIQRPNTKVISADIDERFIQYVQAKRDTLGISPGLFEVRQIPEDSPGMRPDEVDIAYMVNVYHHIENRTFYFKRLHDMLKPGGRLMIIDYKKEDTPHGPPTSMRLSPQEVQQELSGTGFQIIVVDDKTLPEQYIITAYKGAPAVE